MKNRICKSVMTSVVAGISWTLVSQANAAVVIKANNTNNLDTAGSWTTAAPTSADVGQWDSTVTGANTSAVGANSTWGGIKIVNPGGNVTINVNSSRTLTVGTSGIDMSLATVDATFGGAGNYRIATSSSQTFNVAASRTLNFNSFLNTQGGTITLTLAANGVLNAGNTWTNATSPLNVTQTGTGSVVYSGAVTSNLTSLSATGSNGIVINNGQNMNVNSDRKSVV